jgi:hypothetical protein
MLYIFAFIFLSCFYIYVAHTDLLVSFILSNYITLAQNKSQSSLSNSPRLQKVFSHESSKEKMLSVPTIRVAWLISGSVRTLPLPWVFKSIKTNGIDAFGGNADVFLYLKLNESSDPGPQRDPVTFRYTGWGPRVRDVYHGDPGPAIRHINPLDIEIVSGLEPTKVNMECDLLRTYLAEGVPVLPRTIGQFESWRRSYLMMEKSERKRNISYDWVVHARADSAFLAPLPNFSTWGSSSGKRFYYPYGVGANSDMISEEIQVPIAPIHKQHCFDSSAADWFNIMSRDISKDIMHDIHENYMKCKGDPLPLNLNVNHCCGGGTTSVLMSVAKAHASFLGKFRFPLVIVRSWFGHNFCSSSDLPIPEEDGPRDIRS